MDSKTFAIGVLSLTAVVLLVGLIVVSVMPQPVIASSISSPAGDFTIANGRIRNDMELLYVLDNTTQRLITYAFDRRTGACAPVDFKELSKAIPGGQ
jgi:hypothetical protein